MKPGTTSFGSAVKWAYFMNWGDKTFSALFTFVLASILGPGDFGTVAMATLFISFVQIFLDQGMVAALIQRKNLTKDHLDSAFWMDLVMCVLLTGLTLLAAPWWAHVNRLPALRGIISVLSVCIIIEGLDVVQRAYLQRQMNFRGLSIRSNISVVAGGTIGLLLAYKGFGVWALVTQRLTQDLVALILLWSVSNWRPGWRFSFTSMKEILSFATANFVGKLGTFFNQEADNFLLGLFFGPVAVGVYRLAQRLMHLVLDVATSSLQVVSLSQFSRNQDQPSELRRNILAMLRMSSAITMPALAGLAAASGLIMAAIGPRWAPAETPLRILCFMGMFFSLAYFSGPLMTALGRPHQLSLVNWIMAAINITGLLGAALLLGDATVDTQVQGIALTRFATGVVVFSPVMLALLMRLGRVSLQDILEACSPALVVAAATATSVIVLNASHLASGWKPVPALTVHVLVGALVGVGLTLHLNPDLKSKVLRILYARGVREYAGRSPGEAATPAGEREPDKPLRILVAIANYGRTNDRYVHRLLEEYRSMPFSVRLVVLSNVPKVLGHDVEVVVGLPARDPWSLPFAHKAIFAENVENYDLFIYSEDDTFITEKTIRAYLRVTALLPENEIADFFRTETDAEGRVYYSTVNSYFHWVPGSVRERGSHVFAVFTNDHSACFILTRNQLRRAIASGGFLVPPHSEKYDLLVTAATDPFTQCGMQPVRCISHPDDFITPHLPNRYIGRMGMSREAVDRQIRRLLEIQDQPELHTPLFNVETKLRLCPWSKDYYERAEADVLDVMPESVKSALSIGVGWGALEGALINRGTLVTGLPLDAVIAANAEDRGVSIVSGSFDEARRKLEGQRFGCVIFSNVLHLVERPEQILASYAELIAPGGFVVIGSPNFGGLPHQIRARLSPVDFRGIGHFAESGIQAITVKRIKEMTESVGFEWTAFRPRVFPRIRLVSKWTLHLFDRYLADEFIVVARKTNA